MPLETISLKMADLGLNLSPSINICQQKNKKKSKKVTTNSFDSSSSEDENLHIVHKGSSEHNNNIQKSVDNSDNVSKKSGSSLSSTGSCKHKTISPNSNSSVDSSDSDQPTVKKNMTQNKDLTSDSDSNSRSSDEEEDFSNIRIARRGKTASSSTNSTNPTNNTEPSKPKQKSPKKPTTTNKKFNSKKQNFENSSTSSSDDEEIGIQKTTKKAKKPGNDLSNLMSETARLKRTANYKLPKKTRDRVETSLSSFLSNIKKKEIEKEEQITPEKDETTPVSTTKSTQSLPQNTNQSVPNSEIRRQRAKALKAQMQAIKQQVTPKAVSKKITEVSMVKFDLSNNSNSSQINDSAFIEFDTNSNSCDVPKNSRALPKKSSSSRNVSPKFINRTSISQNDNKNIDENSQSARKIEVLVKRLNPETNTVELANETVHLPEEKNKIKSSKTFSNDPHNFLNLNKISPKSQRPGKSQLNLQSILRKRISADAAEDMKRKIAANEQKMRNDLMNRKGNYNDNFDLEETMIYGNQEFLTASQKRHVDEQSDVTNLIYDGRTLDIYQDDLSRLWVWGMKFLYETEIRWHKNSIFFFSSFFY